MGVCNLRVWVLQINPSPYMREGLTYLKYGRTYFECLGALFQLPEKAHLWRFQRSENLNALLEFSGAFMS